MQGIIVWTITDIVGVCEVAILAMLGIGYLIISGIKKLGGKDK